MSTDRELLELAAKAAGISIVGPTDKYIAQHDKGPDAFIIDNDRGGHSNWNPLADDGDVARLEAACSLSVEWNDHWVTVRDFYQHYAGHKGDKQAARRRASVLAAAEIGKSK